MYLSFVRYVISRRKIIKLLFRHQNGFPVLQQDRSTSKLLPRQNSPECPRWRQKNPLPKNFFHLLIHFWHSNAMIPVFGVGTTLPPTSLHREWFSDHTAIGSVCFNQQRALPFCPCFSLFQVLPHCQTLFCGTILESFSGTPLCHYPKGKEHPALCRFPQFHLRKESVHPLLHIRLPSLLNTYARMPHSRTPQCITLIFLPAFASMLCFLLYISVIFFILLFFVTKYAVFVIKKQLTRLLYYCIILLVQMI